VLWERRAAGHQIVDRQAEELAPALQALIQDGSKDRVTRIHALWALEGLENFDRATVDSLLQSGDDHLVREAIRSLACFAPSAVEVAQMTAPFLSSENAMVRSQLLRTLRELGSASPETIQLLVDASKPAAPNDEMGGNYERNFERFLALMALEDYQPQLRTFLDSPAVADVPATNLLWAVQALPDSEKPANFGKIWTNGTQGEIDPNTFVAMTKLLGNPAVQKTVAPTFADRPAEMLELSLNLHDRIDGPKVAAFYDKKMASDLASDDAERMSSALDLITKLRSPAHTKVLLNLLQSGASPAERLFTALGNDPKMGSAQYRAIVTNEELSNSIRIKALTASSIAGSKTIANDTKFLVSEFDNGDKKLLVSRLSWSKPGNTTLLKLFQAGVLKIEHWDYRSAQRTRKAARKSKDSAAILAHYRALETEAANERTNRVHHYMEALTKLEGNPETGQALFSMCLVCHQANGQGQNIAPSLDGSSSRELEHLLTAIVNPDEAIEGAYGLYYVVKKNGESVEGYRARTDEDGVSIAAQGGSITFIATSDIYDQGGFAGKSFMPSAFHGLPDQTMADLISYMQTLK